MMVVGGKKTQLLRARFAASADDTKLAQWKSAIACYTGRQLVLQISFHAHLWRNSRSPRMSNKLLSRYTRSACTAPTTSIGLVEGIYTDTYTSQNHTLCYIDCQHTILLTMVNRFVRGGVPAQYTSLLAPSGDRETHDLHRMGSHSLPRRELVRELAQAGVPQALYENIGVPRLRDLREQRLAHHGHALVCEARHVRAGVPKWLRMYTSSPCSMKSAKYSSTPRWSNGARSSRP